MSGSAYLEFLVRDASLLFKRTVPVCPIPSHVGSYMYTSVQISLVGGLASKSFSARTDVVVIR